MVPKDDGDWDWHWAMKKRERKKESWHLRNKVATNLPIFLLLILMLQFLTILDVLLHPNFTGCERRNQLQWWMSPLVAYRIAMSSQRRGNNYEKHTEKQMFKV
jgi:hypothetical protein